MHKRNKMYRQIDETDPQYLSYCSQLSLLNKLQCHMTKLRFIFDLEHQSNIAKPKIYPPKDNIKITGIQNKPNSLNQQQQHSQQQQRFQNVLIEDLYYNDMQKLKQIKRQLQQSIKLLLNELFTIRRKNQQQVKSVLQTLYRKVQHNRYCGRKQISNGGGDLRKDQNNNSSSSEKTQNQQEKQKPSDPEHIQHRPKQKPQQNNSFIQSYLQSLQAYLLNKIGDIDLYQTLKQITLRWLGSNYLLEQQRYNTLLFDQIKIKTIENHHQKPTQISQQNSILQNKHYDSLITNESTFIQNHEMSFQQKSKQNQKQLQKINEKVKQLQKSLQTRKAKSKNPFPIVNDNDQAFLSLLHQSRTVYLSNLLYAAATIPIDNFSKPCCINFFYHYSQIQTNKFHSSPNNFNIIFITRQSVLNEIQGVDSLKLNEKQNQKLDSNRLDFKDYETPIKNATSALLNNNGGFIFIGFRKQGLNYVPQSPFLISEDSVKTIRKRIQDIISKQISLLSFSNDNKETAYKNFTVDFIPILKKIQRFYTDNKLKAQAQQNPGQYVWRIIVKPDFQSKLKIHSIAQKFYDLDRVNETYIQITDTENQKDTVYRKFKQIQEYYNRYTNERRVILSKNPYKLVTHLQPCRQPLISNFAQICEQIDVSVTKQIQQSQQLMKKKQQKALHQSSKVQSTNRKIQQKTKNTNTDYNDSKDNQELNTDFKQVNLIVLESKSIKQSCQRFFTERKIQFKIQKLQSQYLKKLSKQTYLIYHHKKFDDINNYLSEFKKGYNSKKNISLISAERSVYVDQLLDSKKLAEIRDISMREMQQDMYEQEAICYLEDIKDKQQRSFIKATNKMGGIYLYFILSQLGMKPKMKNVPNNLQANLLKIDEAIKQKSQEQKNRANLQNNSSNYKNSKYSRGQKQHNLQIQQQWIDKQKHKQIFIKRYIQILKQNPGKDTAQMFYQSLCLNGQDYHNFFHFKIYEEETFAQVREICQKNYGNTYQQSPIQNGQYSQTQNEGKGNYNNEGNYQYYYQQDANQYYAQPLQYHNNSGYYYDQNNNRYYYDQINNLYYYDSQGQYLPQYNNNRYYK